MKVFLKTAFPVGLMFVVAMGVACLSALGETGAKSRPAPDANAMQLAQKATTLLNNRCFGCHNHGFVGPDGNSRISWGKDVPRLIKDGLIVPGQPEKSKLCVVIADLQHPKKNPLTLPDAKLLVDWVKQGAVDPNPPATRSTSRPSTPAAGK